MAFWWTTLAVTALGGLFFVAGAGAPAPRALTAPEAARAEELRRAIRHLPQAEFAVWQRSQRCETPRSSADRATCDAIHGRDAQYRAELAAIEQGTWGTGWTPRELLGGGQVTAMSGALRRLALLILSLAAIAGAGLLGRLGVLASAESYRLAEGTASPAPAAGGLPMPIGTPLDVTAAITPADIFSMWANQRLRPNDAASVISEAAYQDYVETARLNGVLPISLNEFGKLLRGRAEASEGRVIRTKIAGKMTYRGWQLVTDLAEARSEPVALLPGTSAGTSPGTF